MQCLVIANAAYINIEQAVIVDINYRNTRIPAAVIRNFCIGGYISKMQIAGIEK